MKHAFLLIGFFFLINVSYGQKKLDRKTRLKIMKKIKRTYNYSFFESKCNKVLVGDEVLGGNDGGGRMLRGVNNIKIIALTDKKLSPWKSPYTRSYSTFNTIKKDKGLIRVIGASNKVGLLSVCDQIVLKPSYDEIGRFNKDGFAVASIGNKIDVINLKGKSVLEKPFTYIFDAANHEKSISTTQHAKRYPEVVENMIIISKDNRSFGLFDILSNKIITPLVYDFIDTNPFINNRYSGNEELIGYKAHRENRFTVIGFDGKELFDPLFYTINKFYKVDDKMYVFGAVDSDKKIINSYDIANKTFVLPEEVAKETTNIKAIDSDKLILELRPKKTGIYSLSQKKFIIEPSSLYKFRNGKIKTNFKGFVIINLDNGSSKFFNLKTGKLISANMNASYKSINIKGATKENNFILKALQPNRKSSDIFYTLYKEDGSIVFENIKMISRDLHIKNNFFYIEEKINCYPCQKMYTAFDSNGKLIGEIQKYDPTKK